MTRRRAAALALALLPSALALARAAGQDVPKAPPGDAPAGVSDSRSRRAHVTALLTEGREKEAADECRRFLADLPDDKNVVWMHAVLTALRLPGKTCVDPEYRGKYERDPRLAEGRERLTQSLSRAFSTLRARLDQPDRRFPEVLVHVEDARGLGGHELACTCFVPRGGRWDPVVMVAAEHVVAGVLDCDLVLAHELVHAVRGALPASGDALPWLEEGIAHWVSDVEAGDVPGFMAYLEEGTSEQADAMTRWLKSDDILSKADPDTQRAAGAILLWDLEQRLGLAKVREFARAWLDGGDGWKLLRTLDPREPRASLRDLQQRAPTLLDSLVEDRAVFSRVVALDDEEKGAETLALVDELLSKHAKSYFRQDAEFLRGHALFLLHRYDDALRQLRAAQRPAHDPALSATIALWIVLTEEAEHQFEAVVKDGRDFLRDCVLAPEDDRKTVETAVATAERWIAYLREHPEKK